METNIISVKGAKEHNLKNVDVEIPKNQLVVVTGLSGSGKSSLAFDTIYAEGQRRYVESLSAYARQFLQLQDKPDVEHIDGLSPAIAIEQKTTSKNPRSTVGTVTEIYDYMRLLWARIGVAYSPVTGKPIESQTVSQMVDQIIALPEGAKILLLAPIARGAKGEHKKELAAVIKSGFERVMINGSIYTADELPELDKNKKHDIEIVVDRVVVKKGIEQSLADSVETCLRHGDGLMFVEFAAEVIANPPLTPPSGGRISSQKTPLPEGGGGGGFKKGDRLTFSEHLSCPESGFSIGEIEPRMFSFNSPYGACQSCDGIGTEIFFDPNLIIPDKTKALSEGAIAPWASGTSRFYRQTLESLSQHYKFSMHKPWKELPENVQELILNGSGEEKINFTYDDNARRQTVTRVYDGVIPSLERRWRENQVEQNRDTMSRYQNYKPCSSCDGHRLKPESLCVKVGDLHIGEVTQKSIDEAVEWFGSLNKKLSAKDKKIAERVLKEIRERLGFLQNVGLDYLTLSRKAGTLSGGESQRIRLASQIGSGLSGVLYVLDEPSIGLHQCDNDKLLETLKNLRDLGNTVMVVEHDEETMRQADYLLDIGPGAGVHGGEIIAEGTPKEVMKSKSSLTADYLRGDKFIAIPKNRRKGAGKHKKIEILNARSNNLQNVDAEIPLGTFTCVTGVSGGGKSTLTIQTLYKAAAKILNGAKTTPGLYDKITGLEYVDKIIEIDQSPIGRTPRSNPATYTGAFNYIRDWFADLPESKARGYKPGRFSFNVKGGRCEACQGDGMIKIEMHFLPDVYVKCDECHGARYNRETLEVKYKDKSISDVLNMTVEDALAFFANHPQIKEKLAALNEVGLSYIRIGQSATTLSGGEAQRIKLAKELSRRATGRTLYILDEPTTGLHSHDIDKLLGVLHKLVDSGNTCVVIEHNLDVIKTADYIIDIGPGGGHKGGKIVGTGTPEELAKNKASVTGEYLQRVLPRAGGNGKNDGAKGKSGGKKAA